MLRIKKLIDQFFHLPSWLLAFISTIFLLLLGILCLKIVELDNLQKYEYYDNPEKYHNPTITIFYVQILEKKNNLIIGKTKQDSTYQFVIDTNLVKLNHWYSFQGPVQNDHKILVKKFQEHPFRFLKYVLSLLSSIIVIYLLIKYIKFENGYFTIKSDNRYA